MISTIIVLLYVIATDVNVSFARIYQIVGDQYVINGLMASRFGVIRYCTHTLSIEILRVYVNLFYLVWSIKYVLSG